MIKYAPAPLPAAGRPPATADAINARRRMAESLVNEGTSYAPVQSWTQGAARVAQAALGQHELNQTAAQSRDLAEFDENQATRKRMAERLAAMDDKKHMTEWERSQPPTQGELLDQQYKQAQIAKMQREASGAAGALNYGVNPVYGVDANGRPVIMQMGNDGSIRRPDMPEGVSPLGPGETAEARGHGSALGKGKAEGQLALPKSAIALKQYQEQDKIVGETIDRAISKANGWTTGLWGSAASKVPGTAAHGMMNDLNTIKANLGFDKLQAMRDASPTGGALGQVSEMENILLQSVWGSIEQSQTQEELVQNLNRIKSIRQQYAILKQQAYDADVARFGAGAVPNPSAPGPETAPPQNPTPDAYKSKYGLD